MKRVLLSAGLALMASFAFAATNRLDRVLANGTAEAGDESSLQTASFALDVSKFKRGNNPAQHIGLFRMTLQSVNKNYSVRLLRTTSMQIEDIEEGGKKITIQGTATATRGSYFNRQNAQGNITIVVTDNSGNSGDSIKVIFTQSGFAGLPNFSFIFDGSVVSGQLQLIQRVWEN
jgi:hypothetical protein